MTQKKKWPHLIKLIIFDNDGTILDTEGIYSWANEQMVGHELDATINAQLVGKNAHDTCKAIVDYYNINTNLDNFIRKRTKLLENCWNSTVMMPGAKKLITKFYDKGIPMAIATSSRASNFKKKIQAHMDVYNMIGSYVCGNEVINGKPAPDIYLKACEKYPEVDPKEALVIEDSPYGIKAANEAGMASILVTNNTRNYQETLKNLGAVPTYTMSSLEMFSFDLFTWDVDNLII
ncbi:HAD-superfamily hydrolase, subfamily IA, variant 3 containing protein [Trichomonas vaginalis G3]|uniref:HAD-superfamily hydrolase, subfamily IA, variant 3 containing protein n=1 Tax=Trichomonas vaginalis (strain ATCC PRA-98 / G3) TaxID=412133 RepID=A2DGS2_TRIV3|nr:pseudouridine 5'-phosphatase protein [Trichomonas vaginalis G3]EAY20459.1 HAD-superfamily hydrolase, subfamily IA, variant 3 containing protein [Trichomonas vaginalis G3]KAI5490491.1 pseudouridine 5'-phosphatase protein [Trichomonas vaginalis G3]|eukprot:XP_001581445.1 HAD-superfamily hydrolase, subfamily IA, variant 3 containing protein [Trichomonas vaginalis G3]